MLIGEISKKSGISRDTIRFYEKKGLLTVKRTESEWNNYKEYSNENLNKLLLIKKAKNFGFTLNEITELFTLFELNSASCPELNAKVNTKIAEIDKKIVELQNLKEMISNKALEFKESCQMKNGNENCEIVKNENKL